MSHARMRVRSLIEGYRSTALIAAAVQSGLFDALADGADSADALQRSGKFAAANVQRMLDGLCLLGLVSEAEEVSGTSFEGVRRYQLTDAGRLLLSVDAEGEADYALLSLQQYVPAWCRMEDALLEGKLPFEQAFGCTAWQFRKTHPQQGNLYDRWLAARSASHVESILDAFDFGKHQRIADVGGGHGALLLGILRRFESVAGVLADQGHVVSAAERVFRQAGVWDRCQFLETDFFRAVPKSCDLYLLKSVLHDWDDLQCREILSRVREAMSDSSRLLVLERIRPQTSSDDPNVIWQDLHMMCVLGGRERSEREYIELFHAVGLRLEQIIPGGAPFRLFQVAA